MSTSERGKESDYPMIDIDDAIRMQDSVLQRYVQWQDSTLFYAHHGEHNAPELTYVALGLAGEAGEAGDEVKKIIRKCGQRNDASFDKLISDPKYREPLIKELGDVFYYLIRELSLLGLTMNDIAKDNCTKLCKRHNTPNPFTGED